MAKNFLTVCVIFLVAATAVSANNLTENITMNLFKVLISNPTVPKIAYEVFSNKVTVITTPNHDRQTLLKNITGVDALFWSTKGKVDKELLDAAGPQLKVVGTMSAGYNHIDLCELKSRGIKLSNTPAVLNKAVADIAILLALSASRRVTEGRWHIERGTWPKDFDVQFHLGRDISDSTVGIIGFGGIGQEIAKRLSGFEIGKLLYTGHREKPEAKKFQASFVNLDTLLSESDYIFICAPLNNETEGMCNKEFFKKMKKTGIFINVSRGQLVDQSALIEALKSNEIFAAGLDVMDPEPLNTDSELLKLPNVVLTPHSGSATQRTRDSMAQLTAQNILRALGGEEMFTPVDLDHLSC